MNEIENEQLYDQLWMQLFAQFIWQVNVQLWGQLWMQLCDQLYWQLDERAKNYE